MDKEQIDQVLSRVLDNTPEVKLRSGRRYAHGRTEPGGLIAIAALKDRIRVSFITEGKGSDVSPERFLEWMNASGVLSEKAFGETGFILREGARNPHKREVCAEVLYDERTADEIVTSTVAAYHALLENLSGFFSPKVDDIPISNNHTDETQPQPKKVGLSFRYENGDTGETFEESSYTVDSDSTDLQGSLNDWLELRTDESLKRFALDLMGNPDFNGCEDYGAAFEELKKVFFWRGVDRLGWGDVMVQIFEISVNGELVELTEIELETMGYDCKVQLERDANPDMYMLDCEL
jgi:hypothetical protein